MGVDGPVQQGEDALDVVVDARRVNDGPVGNFCPFDQSLLDLANSWKAGEVTIGPTVGVGVP